MIKTMTPEAMMTAAKAAEYAGRHIAAIENEMWAEEQAAADVEARGRLRAAKLNVYRCIKVAAAQGETEVDVQIGRSSGAGSITLADRKLANMLDEAFRDEKFWATVNEVPGFRVRFLMLHIDWKRRT